MSRKRKNGSFLKLPHNIILSPEYAALSNGAARLLVDLLAQYNGSNNGDFCASFNILNKRGWKSKSSLQSALKELQEKRFIEKSRQGGRNQCSLFASAFYSIDECKGKIDLRETKSPSNAWKYQIEIPTPNTGQATPNTG